MKRMSLLVAGLWLSGCTALLQEPTGDAAEAASSSLAGTRWRVETIAGRALPDAVESTVAFGADGRIFGSAGCNHFSGSYRLDGNDLSVAELVTTRKICFPAIMAHEQSLLRVLQGAQRIEQSRELLILESANEKRESRLVAAPG